MTRLQEMARAAYMAAREIAISQYQTEPWLPWEEMREIDRQRLIVGMRAAIEALKVPNDFMRIQGGQITQLAHWTPRMFWEGTLDAVLDEQP